MAKNRTRPTFCEKIYIWILVHGAEFKHIGKNHYIKTYYHKNGVKAAEFNLINGKYDGLARHWHDNGIKYSSYTCVQGILHGTITNWDKNGVEIRRVLYAHGKEQCT